ncbi:hypothetical protein BKK80_32060 [Cupriavidus malaysiensis]|uniref:Branched-chain amino acid ABC transporter substrate-binding protein n=2 Tax=Cupriavidus malaysiensis TaxID=367825 RepID=A0ABM6FEE1_9BURK|nr:hypothetical protein BKK80_32060 [Cupriavidus malaysiensis]
MLATALLLAAHAPARAQQADPPARVATVTERSGGLSLAPAGSDAWVQASPNRPISTGDSLWVDPAGRTELHIGSTALRLGGGTAIGVLNLDDTMTQVRLTQGTLQLRVRALPAGQSVEIDTPNLALVPAEPGDYRLDVAADGSTTMVTVRRGRAELYGDTRSLALAAGERIRLGGTDLADAGPVPYGPEDDFDRWTLARDAREDASRSARYVSPEMPGYQELDAYGAWEQDQGYGAVWYPNVVAADWVPYSSGNWVWIAPWGWTWVDSEPWGFAPFHYGRWAFIGHRWGWVPGPRVSHPCYAPALVAFVGAAAAAGPGVAWYPLGPAEPYRPVYRASPAYVARVNVNVNVNVAGGGGRPFGAPAPGAVPNRLVPGAISVMSAAAFVQGRPVAHGARRGDWRHLPAGEGQGAPLLAPVQASLAGAAAARHAPPPAGAWSRPVVALRAPARRPPDELAGRFAREGATVPGAGAALHAAPVPAPSAAPGPGLRLSRAGQPPRAQVPAIGAQPPRQPPAVPPARGSQEFPRGGPGMPGAPMPGTQPGRAGPAQPFETPQRQQQEMPRQQADQQRQMQEQQRLQQEMQRHQADQQRQQADQQRQVQEQQRQQQEAQRHQADQQRQQADQQRQMQEQQRLQQEAQRHQADQQRQQADQQRQMQEQQRLQQEMQRHQADQQRQQADQQRQMQEQQRQQQETQRHQADQQRQQADQQRQMQEQQRQQQEMQRRQADQQRQAQELQRQQAEQQRQMQEQQRRQADQQRQMQEQQQRQMQEQQRQMQEQQRQMQEMQRRQADQQRQAQEQQRQQAEQQRQQFQQQRQMQEQQQQQQQQRQQQQMQEQQRQQQDAQRRQREQQQQQQQQQQQPQR